MIISWKVLLIGGASGLGKSVVARAIAEATGASLREADDVRMALQAVTAPDEKPALHFFVRSPGVALGEPGRARPRGGQGIDGGLAPISFDTIHALSRQQIIPARRRT